MALSDGAHTFVTHGISHPISLLTDAKIHRGLLILHLAKGEDRIFSVWHIMYEANGCKPVDQQAGGRYTIDGTESCGGYNGRATAFWAAEGEAVCGDWCMVCAEV
jgi:hypothetical protein